MTNTDAISRQAVQDYIAKYLSQYLYDDVREAVEVIDEYIGELPSVNPTMTITEFADKCRECGSRYGKRIKELESNQPKTGHWERTSCSWILKCSNCDNMPHRDEAKYYKYCPNCGAKMVEEQERSEE